MRVPSTGVLCGRASPMAFHSPPTRLQIRSVSNASGAMARARAYTSSHDVPGFTIRLISRYTFRA